MERVNGLEVDRMENNVYVLAEDHEGCDFTTEMNRAIHVAKLLQAEEDKWQGRGVWIQCQSGSLLTIAEARKEVRYRQMFLDF